MTLTAENRWKGGRGKARFTYTYTDIARLTGLTYQTVRKYAALGKYNPSSLESVYMLVTLRQGGGLKVEDY